MNSENVLRASSYVFKFAVIISLVAILPIESFGFYMFVRTILFIGFVFYYLNIEKLEDTFSWIVALIGAFLWNPFFIVENDKSVWIILDLIAAGFFIYWSEGIRKAINKQEEHKKRINEERVKDPAYYQKQTILIGANEKRDAELREQQWEEVPNIILGVCVFTLMCFAFYYVSIRGWLPHILGVVVILGLVVSLFDKD